MDKRDITQALEVGQRNQQVVELIQNWCGHARVVGNRSFLGAQAGLPIGRMLMECDHAHSGGFSGLELAATALDFHDRNCISCEKRMPLGFPNLSELVGARDRTEAERRKQAQGYEEERQRAALTRRERRIRLRQGQSAATVALLDDIDSLDESGRGHSKSDAAAKIVETAKLAREVFTPEVVDYLYELVDGQEAWATSAALSALRHLRPDRSRLVNAALRCLARHEALDEAGEIVELNADHADEGLVGAAVGAAAHLAKPPRGILGLSRPYASDPGPLSALYERWPAAVISGIDELLSNRSTYHVSAGLAAIDALTEWEPRLATQFSRSIAAKLARMHLAFDEVSPSHDIEDICFEMQDVLALALTVDAVATDTLLHQFLQSANGAGEGRIAGVYERFLRAKGDDDKGGKDDIVCGVAIKRLLQLATSSDNEAVLDEVVDALHSKSQALQPIAELHLDAFLGAAALLDDKLKLVDQQQVESPASNLLQGVQRHSHRELLLRVRERLVSWAAFGAAGSLSSTARYVEFLAGLDETRDDFVATLVLKSDKLLATPEGLNALLPELYTALVGASVKRRAMAASMLGELKPSRAQDLPHLVLEAFVALLSDRYVMVHQYALEALENIDLPGHLEIRAKRAVADWIGYYRQTKESPEFFVRCLELYLQRFTPDDRKPAVASFIVECLKQVKLVGLLRRIRWLSRNLSSAEEFPQLVVDIIGRDELESYEGNTVIDLLYEIPLPGVCQAAESLVQVGIKRIGWNDLVGALIEVLTRAGSFRHAVSLAEAACSRIPSTTHKQREKWRAQMQLLATQVEEAVADRRLDDIRKLRREWDAISHQLQEDQKAYAKRRHPAWGLSPPDAGT